VTFRQAALVEPLSVAVHAVGRMNISLGDTAVVIGSGMIGLLVIQSLRAAGCGRIIAVDLDPRRLELARKLGADVGLQSDPDHLLDQILEKTASRGADIGVDAVGLATTVQMAVAGVRKGGQLALVGNLAPKVELPLQSVVTRELTLLGSCASSGEYPSCLEMIARGTVDVDALISAAAELADGAAWFQRLREGREGLLKVILEP